VSPTIAPVNEISISGETGDTGSLSYSLDTSSYGQSTLSTSTMPQSTSWSNVESGKGVKKPHHSKHHSSAPVEEELRTSKMLEDGTKVVTKMTKLVDGSMKTVISETKTSSEDSTTIITKTTEKVAPDGSKSACTKTKKKPGPSTVA